MDTKTFKAFIRGLNYQFRDAWQDSLLYTGMDVVDDLSMFCMM